jgi:hypothetical protein
MRLAYADARKELFALQWGACGTSHIGAVRPKAVRRGTRDGSPELNPQFSTESSFLFFPIEGSRVV